MTAHPPILDRMATRTLDRRAVDEFGIPGIVLMENAARGVLAVALDMLGSSPARSVAIMCGCGNNGGDGYALARMLDEAGVDVRLVAMGPCRVGTDAESNQSICRRMRLPILPPDNAEWTGVDLLVDALFGTGLDRPLAGAAAELVSRMNDAVPPILAVDVPSGLDCDIGSPVGGGPCILASRTVTFACRKPGLLRPEAATYTGSVTVAPIGIPFELLRDAGNTR